MKVLTKLQEQTLKILFGVEDIRRHFYLTGGTALSAFYLEHRYSDDLDIFTHDIEIDSIERVVVDSLKKHRLKIKSERSSPTFRRYLIDNELQLDLVKDIEQRIGSPQLIDGIMVDSEKNIAVNKVGTIYGRLDAKDYVDLYFLLKTGKYDILDLIKLGKQKDGGLEEFQWAKIVADVESFSKLPRMIVDCNLDDIKTFFHELRNKVIDSIKPK